MPLLQRFDAPDSFFPLMDALDRIPDGAPYPGIAGEAVWRSSPYGITYVGITAPRVLAAQDDGTFDSFPLSLLSSQGRLLPSTVLHPYAVMAEQGNALSAPIPSFEWQESDDSTGLDIRAFFGFPGALFFLDTVHDATVHTDSDELLVRSGVYTRATSSAHRSLAQRDALAPLMDWATRHVQAHFDTSYQHASVEF